MEGRFDVHVIERWGADEAQAYLDSKGLKGNAARIAEIASGRPGFIAELAEILDDKGQLDGDLAEVTMASLVPGGIDEDELEVPDSPPAEGEKKHASADDSARVMHLAALLGAAFPSNLVADMGGYDRDSIDDLLDAMSDLFEEVQFSKELDTWIYRFKRGCYREGVLEANDTDEGHDLARRVGVFMEQYLVPRGYGFIVKTARVYAEHGAPMRARLMRAQALSNDNADVWSLAYDFIHYFDEIDYPDALRRTVYTNLLDRLASGGNTQAAERVHTTVSEWVEAQGSTLEARSEEAAANARTQALEAAEVFNARIDAGEAAEGVEKVDPSTEADKAAQRARESLENDHKGLLAWLLFTGSRIDLRRQDLFRARDRARDALTAYTAAGDNGKVAEVHNHMAGIELQDGNAQAALDAVEQALQAGQVQTPDGKVAVLPNVLATAEQIRGLVARRAGQLEQALKHFRTANEVAGRVGLAGLALDSGLSFGEALLVSGQTEQGRDALRRVLQIAQSLRNPVRERQAAELLAQAEGALKNYEAALPLAARTLQLSQALQFEHTLPIDLYNLGFFHFMTNKPSEAISYFAQSEQRIGGLGKHPVVKELHYFKGLAHLRTGDLSAAKASLRNGLRPMQEAKDWPKMCSALDALANIEERQGNKDVAKKLLTDAIGFAKQANLKEQRKQLKRRLDSIR
jgi:tetratricopeptide (TPR) repeat protein